MKKQLSFIIIGLILFLFSTGPGTAYSSGEYAIDNTGIGLSIASAGVGLEDLGSGTLAIEINIGGPVISAYLYWAGRGGSISEPLVPRDQELLFAGEAVSGDVIGLEADAVGYRADVTSIVTASYISPATYSFDIQDGDISQNLDRLNGASLLVVYTDELDAATYRIMMFDGLDYAYKEGWDCVPVTFNYDSSDTNRSAELLVAVGDTEADREDRVDISDNPSRVDELDASSGESWDHDVFPINIPPGIDATTVEVISPPEFATSDSLVWVLTALRLPVPTEPFCGDGTIDPDEECDDGNTIPGDGCDENCNLEEYECIEDGDCKDNNFCNGAETCVDGTCQPGTDPCPDDGLYCNGDEGCDEASDICTHSGDPCAPQLCDEGDRICVDCLADSDCDDGLYCNGEETCRSDGVCQPGTDPCPDDGLYCNGDEGCDEASDACTHSGDPCAPQLCDEDADECVEEQPCNIQIYEGGSPVPPCNTYSKPGRRGLILTCGETVQFSECTDCDCLSVEWDMAVVSGIPPAGTAIDPITGLLTIGPDCTGLGAPAVIEVTVSCETLIVTLTDTVEITIGEVVLSVEDQKVSPADDSVEVTINLDNPNHAVRAIEVDLADVSDCLTCTGCTPDSDRALDYTCSANEQAGGSCKVVLASFNPAGMIEEGGGAVLTVDYVGDCPDCVVIYNGAVLNVADRFGDPLCACFEEGEICEYACGDIYPRECLPDDPECGDGVVDIFDILEEIDFVLNVIDPSACQEARADVPTGTPPYCGCIGDETCLTDGVIDIFDALVIIHMALDKANCCEYCMDGQISK